LKLWPVIIAAAAAVGCQAQQKPPVQTSSPSVLDVTAPPAKYQPTSYTLAASSVAVTGPAYVPPVAGPAYVPPPKAAPAAPAPTITRKPTHEAKPAALGRSSYTVKHGDTLYRIAKQHYGDGKQWRQIADANPGLTPATLQAGQKLVMP
jgi:nucleoid-associated protein YgaU